jgi:hypothetical protein
MCIAKQTILLVSGAVSAGRATCCRTSLTPGCLTMPLPNAEEVAEIAAALVRAIAEATTQLREEGVGGEFPRSILQARELHTRLLEALIAAEPAVNEQVRGLCDTIGNRIDNLEQALRE